MKNIPADDVETEAAAPRLRRVLNLSLQPVFAFLSDDEGALHPTTTFLILTVAVSIPMGFFCLSMYRSLCGAGRLANLLIGLF